MVYAIQSRIGPPDIQLVKAKDREELKRRLPLRDGFRIVGAFTTFEMRRLKHESFCVIDG